MPPSPLRRLVAPSLLSGCLLTALAQTAAGPDPLGTQPTTWSPLSTTSQVIGPITTAPGTLTVLGHPIPLTSPEILSAQDIRNAADLFSVHATPGSVAALYRVTIPPTFKLREGNTFCGKETVTWLLLLRTPTGFDKGLSIAAFSSAARPDLTPAVINKSLDLCVTLGYVPADR